MYAQYKDECNVQVSRTWLLIVEVFWVLKGRGGKGKAKLLDGVLSMVDRPSSFYALKEATRIGTSTAPPANVIPKQ